MSNKNVKKANALLKLLANNNRLLVLCELANGRKSVGELLEFVDISQSALSQNLIKMREEKLLSSVREGSKIYYEISNNVVKDILEVLYKHYCKDK